MMGFKFVNGSSYLCRFEGSFEIRKNLSKNIRLEKKVLIKEIRLVQNMDQVRA